MTAEIAILNKMAVALAADSKVTIGHEGQEKTYDTVNKLFTLSKVHPVGIMVYGNADFMDFPWETIIKTYRRQKNEKFENTIQLWGEDFLKFLKGYFPFTKEDFERNIKSLMSSIWSDLLNDTQRRLFAAKERTSFEALLAEQIKRSTVLARRSDEFLTGAEHSDFLRKFEPAIDAFIEKLPIEDQRASLKDLMLLSLTRHRYSSLSSGIVFAGFGEEQRLPAISAFILDGFIGKHLKHQQQTKVEITRQKSALIVPYAQNDMVYRFMEGIDNRYRRFLEGSIKELIVSTAVTVLESYCDPDLDVEAAKAAVSREAEEQFKEYRKEAMAYRRQNFTAPIVDMVATLPKEELANMAEALVNLTSLKRRISWDRETVGGPIDVAVISKGDGFIWIRRKHYFDPKLNHHFATNYFREMSGGSHGTRARRKSTSRATSSK